MRFSYVLLAIVAAIAMAEQYAMVFGTADGWGNYSITSVGNALIGLFVRSLAVCGLIWLPEVLSPKTLST